jgi:pyruvate/2-oxoglutarate dehydrogenase complex dihydrolipoamide dehydrogenase (E3) component
MTSNDIVIFGVSFGGVSAALAAARYGKSVALIDATDTVGGQATVQGLTRCGETAQLIRLATSSKSYRSEDNGADFTLVSCHSSHFSRSWHTNGTRTR